MRLCHLKFCQLKNSYKFLSSEQNSLSELLKWVLFCCSVRLSYELNSNVINIDLSVINPSFSSLLILVNGVILHLYFLKSSFPSGFQALFYNIDNWTIRTWNQLQAHTSRIAHDESNSHQTQLVECSSTRNIPNITNLGTNSNWFE